MNALRSFMSPTVEDPEWDYPRRRRHCNDSDDQHRHGHHNHHRREKQNYPANPLGGNRPLSWTMERSWSRGSAGSHSEDSDDNRSVTRMSWEGSSASRASVSSVPGPATAPPSSVAQKRKSILISRPRRATHGTSTTPEIRRTPPTPSPLDQAYALRKRSQTIPGATSQPLQLSKSMPPYPVTPPAIADSPTQSSYLTYHQHPTPAELPTSLRPGSPALPHPATTAEDPYDYLRTFDTLFLIDDSLSMSTSSRWESTSTALSTFASIATHYDSDGIDIHFLNSSAVGRNLQTPAQVAELFSHVQPSGCTPTGAALERILRPYLASWTPDTKPLNIVVITDGAATDDPESVIVWAAKRLESLNAPLSQVGIQFVQIGDEEEAREALMELDDVIYRVHGIRDMVDTVQYKDGEMSGEVVIKVLMGGINRRWDRRRG